VITFYLLSSPFLYFADKNLKKTWKYCFGFCDIFHLLVELEKYDEVEWYFGLRKHLTLEQTG